jgi:dUTP pyrophosphatase
MLAMSYERLEFKKNLPDAILPQKRDEDAGYDLSVIKIDKVIEKTDKIHTVMFDTGVAIRLPSQTVGLIIPRSSIYKQSYTVSLTNGTGVIDSGYRGSIKVILTNMYDTPFPETIPLPSVIVQLVIVPVVLTRAIEVLEFTEDDTVRGEKGFGSTSK